MFVFQASWSRGFNYRHSWLLLHNASYEPGAVEAALAAHDILPDADVVWAAADALLDVYKVKPGLPTLQTGLGLTRACSRRQLAALWAALPTAVSSRRNLQNVFLKGVTIVRIRSILSASIPSNSLSNRGRVYR